MATTAAPSPADRPRKVASQPVPPVPPAAADTGASDPAADAPKAAAVDPEILKALLKLNVDILAASSGPAVIKWSNELADLAKSIHFSLPVSPGKANLPWRIAMAPKNLMRLDSPCLSDASKPRATRKVVDYIAYGAIPGIPCLSQGEVLPLAYVLAILSSPALIATYKQNASLRTLYCPKGSYASLLGLLAESLGRYVYIEDECIKTSDRLTDPPTVTG